jgi:hypothetical protein
LRSRPTAVLDQWIHVTSLRFAFRFAFPLYIIVFSGLYVWEPITLAELSTLVRQCTLIHLPGVPVAIYSSALIAGLASAALFGLTYLGRRIALRYATAAERLRVTDFGANDEVNFSANESDDELGLDDDDEGRGGYQEHAGAHPSGSFRTEKWYEILGVSASATRDEVETAWRDKIRMNHPDLVARLDPSFRALAEERTKRLNAAREEG